MQKRFSKNLKRLSKIFRRRPQQTQQSADRPLSADADLEPANDSAEFSHDPSCNVAGTAIDSPLARKLKARKSILDPILNVSMLSIASTLHSTTQSLLASSLSGDLNAMLHKMAAGPASIYDKAMDAEYLHTFTGGGNHRMFDGGHTLAGALKAVRDAAPDDSITQEAIGYVESLFKDLTTPKGLPLITWNKETYDQAAEYFLAHFGIPKEWFCQINSYNAADLIGAVSGTLAIAFAWNKSTTEEFARHIGAMALPAILKANPLLLVVTVLSLAKAFHKARANGEYIELIDGTLKGGVTTGASMAAVASVSAFGGPAGLVLLAGISVSMLAAYSTRKVSVTQISDFVAKSAKNMIDESKILAKKKDDPSIKELAVV